MEKSLCGCSPLGSRVRVDLISRDCESEISEILLIGDLRVVDISDLNIILDMDYVGGLLGLSMIVTLGGHRLHTKGI